MFKLSQKKRIKLAHAITSLVTFTASLRASFLKKRSQKRSQQRKKTTTASFIKQSQQIKKSLIIILRIKITPQELKQRHKEKKKVKR